MKYVQKFIKLASLVLGENPRNKKNLNIPVLAENIQAIGLIEPITVWRPGKDDVYEVIRGHRRTMALQYINTNSPAEFLNLFPNGEVRCQLVEGITREEAVMLKLDHGPQVTLSDPYELQHSANMLFAIGKTEGEVSVQLAPLIEKISPMRSKAVADLKALQDKLTEATKASDMKAMIAAEKAVSKYIADYRRGFVQNLHNAYRCPTLVMNALYKKDNGENPEGVTVYLPRLTVTEITKLHGAHMEDLTVVEAGVSVYSKDIPGPTFKGVWDAIVKAEEAAEGKPKEVRPKAMSAADMKAELEQGFFKSEFGQLVTRHHSGDKSNDERLPSLDSEARAIELVRKHKPDLYLQVTNAAAEIVAALNAKAPVATK